MNYQPDPNRQIVSNETAKRNTLIAVGIFVGAAFIIALVIWLVTSSERFWNNIFESAAQSAVESTIEEVNDQVAPEIDLQQAAQDANEQVQEVAAPASSYDEPASNSYGNDNYDDMTPSNDGAEDPYFN